MKYIWLILLMLIILKIIRQSKHFETQQISSRGVESINPQECPLDRPSEGGHELGLPGNLIRSSSEVTVNASPEYKDISEQLTGNCRKNDFKYCNNQDNRVKGSVEMDMNSYIHPRDFVKGMIWFQILGPRGGIKPKKLF
ncbi:MAG: hypothetical protein PHO01_02055 [Desulfotomaculaceae bacterium]|nr:hypothetical protein [Desulfotomaculaceae bacterium]